MIQLLLILTLILCVILVAIVLVQNPKGGGLSSNFSSSTQLMGVQKTGDFLEKGTWGFAIVLMALTMMINIAVKGGVTTTGGASSGRDRDIKAPAQSSPFQQSPAGQAGQSPAGTGANKAPGSAPQPVKKP